MLISLVPHGNYAGFRSLPETCKAIKNVMMWFSFTAEKCRFSMISKQPIKYRINAWNVIPTLLEFNTGGFPHAHVLKNHTTSTHFGTIMQFLLPIFMFFLR